MKFLIIYATPPVPNKKFVRELPQGTRGPGVSGLLESLENRQKPLRKFVKNIENRSFLFSTGRVVSSWQSAHAGVVSVSYFPRSAPGFQTTALALAAHTHTHARNL